MLINLEELRKIEEELLQTHEYLPVLIRRYLKEDYRGYLLENNITDEKLYNQLEDTRRLSNKEVVNDLQNWFKQHKEYNYLFNEKEYRELQNELQKIDKEYEGLNVW